MIINNKECTIEDLSDLIDFSVNKLNKISENLLLTNYQISILKNNNIDLDSCKSLSDVIFLAGQAYQEDEDEDLEIVLAELSERNYYENSNK